MTAMMTIFLIDEVPLPQWMKRCPCINKKSQIPASRGARPSLSVRLHPGATGGACVDRRNAGAAIDRRLLQALVLDQRMAVIEQRAQFRVLRGREVALGLDDEEVRREAHVEPALLGVEPLLRESARDGRGLIPRQSALHL